MLALVLCIWLMSFSFPAQSAFTDSLTIGSAKALALGHAVTADPPNIDSIHFNPAGLIRLKGRQMHLKFLYGTFETEYEFGDYGDYQRDLLNRYASYNPEYMDENGNLTEAWKEYVYDEALNSHSEAAGATVMLPGGMVDLPFSGGVMGGASYTPPGSRFTFATNVYTPMMSGFYRKDDDPGRFLGQRSAFTLLTYFSPSVAYEVSDELQLGMSINFSYSGMGFDLPVREAHEALFFYGSPLIKDNLCNPDGTPISQDLPLCVSVSPYTVYADLRFEAEQRLVMGYNLGMLWSPQPWVTFGLSYNSAIKVDMEGDYQFPLRPGFWSKLRPLVEGGAWPGFVAAAGAAGFNLGTQEDFAYEGSDGSGKINVSYTLPQRVNFGISTQITRNWKLNLDIRWTEWSVFSELLFQFDRDIALLSLGEITDKVGTGGANGIFADHVFYALGLKDVTYGGVGTEYQVSKKLALRAGIENRPSAVPKKDPNAFIPINDGILYTLGFGYGLDGGDNIDFGLGYMESKTHFPPCSAKLGNGCKINDPVYQPYLGQDIKSKVSFLIMELTWSRHF